MFKVPQKHPLRKRKQKLLGGREGREEAVTDPTDVATATR